MTRRVMFSAAHALWNSDWTPDANRAVYGTAANPEPTGHNYTLDVAVTGKIHPHTGILVNIKEIDQIVRERVVEVVNNRSLNRAVPAFRYQPVTPENLTEFIRGSLADAMPVGVTLSGIRLEWSPLHVVEWTSKEPNTMQVTQIYEFSASHRLHSEHLSETENEDLRRSGDRLQSDHARLQAGLGTLQADQAEHDRHIDRDRKSGRRILCYQVDAQQRRLRRGRHRRRAGRRH